MHGWENLTDHDRDTILAGIEQGRALGGPYHVEIDPIDVCNVNCFFCNAAEIREGRAVLAWERLGGIIDDLIAGGLRSFRLAGGGEPTIYPQFAALCEKMAAARVVLDNITTNGVKLTGPVLESLLALRISNVYTSLNYSSEADYEKFMRTPGRRFTEVCENIRGLDARLRAAGRREQTCLRTQFMVHHSTVRQLDQMMDVAASLPVDYVAIRLVTDIGPDEQLTSDDTAYLKSRLADIAQRSRGRFWLDYQFAHGDLQPHANEVLAPIHQEGKEVSIDYDPHYAEAGLTKGTIEYCFIGWYSMLIQGTGDVHPCCFLLPNKSIPSFGNVNTQSVAEIWQGEMYRRHREEMRTVMLMQEKVPAQQRRFRCTATFCWSHDACVMSNTLADGKFYVDAHTRLERLRSAPLLATARIMNKASRVLIERGKQMTGLR